MEGLFLKRPKIQGISTQNHMALYGTNVPPFYFRILKFPLNKVITNDLTLSRTIWGKLGDG